MSTLKLSGWVEIDGEKLLPQEVEKILQDNPREVLRFGGEFFFAGAGCRARDHFGIMAGNCPKGTLICNGVVKGAIEPVVSDLPLDEAIITAVHLRSDQGVTALGWIQPCCHSCCECVAAGLEDFTICPPAMPLVPGLDMRDDQPKEIIPRRLSSG
jgi:asparagine synthase (glutamine-hydrolysing)